MKEVIAPRTVDDLRRAVAHSASGGELLSICGSRHAMGGQQFLDGGTLLDMTALDRVLSLDHERGLVTVEAGIQWPALLEGYLQLQKEQLTGPPRWGFRQKQTGADRLTIGGALAANAHGRGLTMAPIVSDVESFTLVAPDGDLIECSRAHNRNLFSLVIGGYGVFGPIATVTLRLSQRRLMRRIVRVIDIEDATTAAKRRIDEGCLYGDFQFDIDPASPDFLTKGVFSCYLPIEGDRENAPTELSRDDWTALLHLAHVDKRRAFSLYAQHYLATDGQTYWSDTHQMGEYVDGYHAQLDHLMKSPHQCSEMITELYVPIDRAIQFLRAAAATLIELGAQVIYGTIRLIDEDTDTVLRWASGRRACIIFNLHVEHTAAGKQKSAVAFRSLIDLALGYGGSFFLTYHRFATRKQLLDAYPQLPQFVKEKQAYDARPVFVSDWYRWIVSALDEK
jgi:FAD/FMN-containing dehydrogenase